MGQRRNPLDLAAGNSLTSLFSNPAPGGPGTGPLDFDLVYIWNGSGYTEYTIDSDYASGVGDNNDNDTVPVAPTINPGTLVFILNNGGNVSVPTTNVLAGTVHVDAAPTGAQTVGTTTTVLHLGLNYVASKLPIGGGLNSVLQLEVGATGGTGQLDFSYVYVPYIVNGAFSGYTVYTVDSDYASGYGDNTITKFWLNRRFQWVLVSLLTTRTETAQVTALIIGFKHTKLLI